MPLRVHFWDVRPPKLRPTRLCFMPGMSGIMYPPAATWGHSLPLSPRLTVVAVDGKYLDRNVRLFSVHAPIGKPLAGLGDIRRSLVELIWDVFIEWVGRHPPGVLKERVSAPLCNPNPVHPGIVSSAFYCDCFGSSMCPYCSSFFMACLLCFPGGYCLVL